MRVMGDIAINSGGYGASYALRSGVGVGATPEVVRTETVPARADPAKGLTSPVGVVDPASGVYVLQFRDSKTGEVEVQYPSAKVVSAYKQGLIQNTSTPTTPVRTSSPGGDTTGVASSLGGDGSSSGLVGGPVGGASQTGAGGDSAVSAAGPLGAAAGVSTAGTPTTGVSSVAVASFTPTDTTA